ncbi:fluoride efflux transporter FluC [Leucobacter chinensis]|uniref:fluoride efflux transporter FluC n=1 Tax=Leucobacter chinensis TaxID=2851010 RepID=UPI001C2426C9|nr:CrcB family protein [Leucobacter chinensis]
MSRTITGTKVALVGLGGALGSLARALITISFDAHEPVALLAVNLSGALLLGMLTALLKPRFSPGSAHLQAFFGVGLLGGFTSYSALCVQAIEIGAHTSPWASVGYLAATLCGGLIASGAGLAAGTIMTGKADKS